MKKHLLITFLIYFSSLNNIVFGQNWSVIKSGEKLNYCLDGNNVITSTIWVDSSMTMGSDSIFFLNRIMCDSCLIWVNGPDSLCDFCYGLINQPQFLQRKCLSLSSGIVNFIDTSNIVINTNAKLNDSWLFDSTQTIYATVAAIGTAVIFGYTDSVKTLVLTTGDTVKLSKKYCLLQYPNGYGQHSYYRLVGIEGRNLGEKVPNFWDIYDFNVGDVFEYHYSGANVNGYGLGINKYVIISKQVIGDTLKYTTLGIDSSHNGYSSILYLGNDTIRRGMTFVDSIHNLSNLYNHQLIFPADYYTPGYLFIRLSIDANNLVCKSFDYENSLAMVGNGLDTLIPFSYVNSELMSQLYEKFKVGLGETDYSTEGFEYVYESHLVAYRKGNVTVGVFTPDGILGVNEISQGDNKLTIYPNPTSNTIYLYMDKNIYHSELRIYNMIGEMVYSETFNGREKTIDFKLSAGIYFVQVLSDNGIWMKKVIKE